MAHEKAIAAAFDGLWGKSLERNWIPGRLGLPGGFAVFNVPDKPGYKYVNKGIEGEEGRIIALDRVGVADILNQRVRMRYEFGEYVIREAEYLDSSGGLSNTLAGLTDVTITSLADGDTIAYDSGLGEWVNTAPGGGGGSTYYAGDAIDIDGGNVISVKVNSSSAIVVDGGSNTLLVNVGDGVKIATNLLTLSLASVPGLEYGTSGDAGKLKVKTGDGVTVDSTGVILNLATDPGLEYSSGQVRVKAYFGIDRTSNGIGVKLKTTSGLVVDIGGLAVGAGDGIDTLTSTIAVDVTDIIDTAAGLKEDASNNIQVRLETNSGLQFGGAGGVQLGTPTTNTVSSGNTVTTTTHAHAITSSSDVGTSPAAAILASTSGGLLTLAGLTLKGNLAFAGGDRSITASNTLTISPSTDLILDPTGLVLTPNAQSIRTTTINDLPTGIDGFNIFNRYSNYTQLTIGAIKADELYIRVFVADETRIDRGEEYWSKSFGIVQADFSLPAINSTVDVWFEDAPAAVTFNLFAVNDYLLCRTIDWSTGLVVQKIWFQVTASKLAQETTAINGIDRQQWRIKRLQGGSTSLLVKRGNLMLDTGVTGQGWVHLSALSQDGGPFVQIGAMTSVSTVPVFTNYVRMGNLKNTVDYSADTYGFAAGDSLGTTPSAGFSGMTAEATNGLRLFNTNIALYDSGVKMVRFDKDTGLTFDIDVSEGATFGRYVRWQDDVDSLDIHSNVRMGAFKQSGANKLGLLVVSPSSATNAYFNLELQRSSDSASTDFDLDLTQLNLTFALNNGLFNFANTGRLLIGNGASGVSTAASKLHVYENTSTTSSDAGITVEQDGAGDAIVQFLLTGVQRWVMGIDNSDSDKFKISSAALSGSSEFTIDTTGNVGIGTTSPAYLLTTEGATNAAYRISVRNTVAGTAAQALLQALNDVGDGFQAGVVSSTFTPSGMTASGDVYFQANGTRMIVRTTGTDDMLFGTNNAERMRILSTGNVGIGLAAPASVFHVYENTSATTSAAGLTIEQDSTGDAVLQFLLTAGQRWMVGIDNSDADKFKITSGTDLGTSPLITLTTDGHVGIGVAAPDADVVGTTDLAQSRIFRIDGSQSTLVVRSTSSSPSISLVHTGASTNMKWFNIIKGTGVTEMIALDDTGATTFAFLTMDHSTGYVGINNTSPGALLDVDGEDNNVVRSTVYGATNWFNYVARRALTSKAAPSAVQLNTIMGSWGALGYSSSGWPAVASAQMQFRAAENYTSTGRGSKISFFVTANGTTTLSNALEIANDGAVVVPYIWATAVNGTAVQINSNGVLTKATSSIRFKKNIREMPSDFGDAFLMAMKPIVYNNKYGDDVNDYVGFVAEDIFGIGGKPFVSFNDAGQVESLHYDKLVVPLVAAVQELIPYKRRIAELESEMADLRARVYAMEGES